MKEYKMFPIKVSGTSQGGDIHEIGFVHLSGFAVEASGASTFPRLREEGGIDNDPILICAGLAPKRGEVGLPIFH